VADLLAGEAVATELARMVGARQGRIQLNFSQRREQLNLSKLGEWLTARDGVTVITQHNSANIAVYQAFLDHGNHAVLFDASGGQGASPETWHIPLPRTSCGYAGGLGPDNLRTELGWIAIVAGARVTWVDMESKLRTRDAAGIDWFDLQRCQDCLREVDHWVAASITSAYTRPIP
jgi:phosphoribosylanthranilate isomerase